MSKSFFFINILFYFLFGTFFRKKYPKNRNAPTNANAKIHPRAGVCSRSVRFQRRSRGLRRSSPTRQCITLWYAYWKIIVEKLISERGLTKKNSLSIFLFTLIFAACQPSVSEQSTTEQTPKNMTQEIYTEQHRPKFHFTPDSMWMNDPNGMVYYEGEYHLFYQFYPDSNVWGPMHWGHAISKDLVHWEHMPIALFPDSLGLVFSGSAVVDKNNTSGFKKGEYDPLVAIFTYHLMEGEESGRDDFQYQAIAYSNDKGRTWTKYKGNPVVPNPGIRDFRDPKVFWHAPTEQWVMILAVKDRVQIYNSSNLKDWSLASEFGAGQGSQGGVWECPDLFELAINGDENDKKWMMIVSLGDGGINGGSASQYFIGDFDGKTFTNDNNPSEILWLDYGRDNYAGVSWSDIPVEDGRRLFIGWMSNWRYARLVPTERWRSAMTIPRTLSLVKTEQGIRAVTQPVAELQQLRKAMIAIQAPIQAQDSASYELSNGLGELKLTFETASDFSISLSNAGGEKMIFSFDQKANTYRTDRRYSGKTDFEESFAGVHLAPRATEGDQHQLHIFIDRSSIEVFADGGQTVMTDLFFPNQDFDTITISSEKELVFSQGKLFELDFIW